MPRHAAHFRIKLRGPIWQVRFTRHGKEHRLSTDEGDQGRAREKAARLVFEHDLGNTCRICGGGGGIVPASAPTSVLAGQFLRSMKDKTEAYRKRAATDLHQYIIDRWESPNEITSKAWEEAKIDWHTQPTERRERLSWGSMANLANTLRAFLRYCASVGVLESVPELRNPSSKQLTCDRAYLRPLDAAEQQAFLWALALAGEARALRIYIALFETWMRKGALQAMTPRWVNFAQERIRIPSAYTKAQRGDLEIDLTPRAAEAIRAEMEDGHVYGICSDGGSAEVSELAVGALGVRVDDGHGIRCDHVSCVLGKQGARVVALDRPIFGPFDYRALFPRIAAVAGIDLTGLTAHHVTRRTAATLAGEKPGASLAALKSQGGWRSSSIVDTYMRASVEAARRVTR